ncbi:hypothetical protein K445DRAFT_269562 [Daldinia sp. EC12]|nr:hypothetical protein K445DRAFT_269562 [Daldinia sp. EC12]
MAADDSEANNTTMERINKLKSFLEDLDDSDEKRDENKRKFNDDVESLLQGQINVPTNDYLGETILHVAARRGFVWAAKLLLEKEANALTTSSNGDTPFHMAAADGYTEMVELFLNENKPYPVNVTARARWEMTALHRAAWGGHDKTIKFLLGAGAKVDAKDVDGWTPLMAATKGRHLSSMRVLLDNGGHGQMNIPDNEGKTPLLVAIEEDFLKGVHLLSHQMPEEDKIKTNIYQRILSYNASTSTDEERDMLRHIQKSVVDALSKDQAIFDEALFKAAARFEWHEIAKKLLTYSLHLEAVEHQALLKSSAIELATQQQKPDLLWWLIATSPRTPEITKNIELALSTAKRRENSTQKLERTYINTSRLEDNYDATDPTNGEQPGAWRHIIDVLEYPQIANEYEDKAALEPPVLKSEYFLSVEAFEVAVANFYKTKHASSTIRRTRNLRDIVYGRGPTNTMTKAISNLKNIMNKSLKDKTDSDRSSRLKAVYDKNNLRFSYVHLPATNIDWMKDLLLRIMIDEKQENNATGYREASSFLQSTWFEIPDRTSVSRYMRPQFMERVRIPSTAINDAQYGEAQNIIMQQSNDHAVNSQEVNRQVTLKGKEQEDTFIPSSALYMPFLSFATQEEERSLASGLPTKLKQQLNILKEDYNDSVVHSSATLDEAYYHFDLENAPTLEERNRRNRSQVVTKQLDSEPKDPRQPRQKPWPLLRVNQIWIWAIDDSKYYQET